VIYELKTRDQIIATFKEKNKPGRRFTIVREKSKTSPYSQLLTMFDI
jgi:hypothetical protein